MDDGLSPWPLLGHPIAISAPFDYWLRLVASEAHYALRAEPGLLRDLAEGWCQAIYVDGSIAHVADYDLLLLVVALADATALAPAEGRPGGNPSHRCSNARGHHGLTRSSEASRGLPDTSSQLFNPKPCLGLVKKTINNKLDIS